MSSKPRTLPARVRGAPKPAPGKLVQTRLPPRVYAAVVAAAQEDGRSVASWLRQLIVHHVDEQSPAGPHIRKPGPW